jgi:hypothetical protein
MMGEVFASPFFCTHIILPVNLARFPDGTSWAIIWVYNKLKLFSQKNKKTFLYTTPPQHNVKNIIKYKIKKYKK